MRIHRYLTATHAEGPGNRFVIWAQGCPIRCRGCYSPELQDPDGGAAFDEETMIRILDRAIGEQPPDDPLAGLTLLGGEPFFQAAPLARVAAHAQEKGLNVITFTGYTIERLHGVGAPEGAAELLRVTDLLIDGPFIEEQYSLDRPMVGSSNQRFLFLTQRLSMRDLEPNCFEIRIEKDGALRINGMGDLNKLLAMLERN